MIGWSSLPALVVAGALLRGTPGAGRFDRLRRDLRRPAPQGGWHELAARVAAAGRRRWAGWADAESPTRLSIDLLAALAAELTAGTSPEAAFLRALADLAVVDLEGRGPVLPATTAALRLAGDVGRALRVDAATERNHEFANWLAGLAVCWEVTGSSGAGLAAAVTRLAATERSRAQVRRELRAELAGPKATATLLALLPVAGILLGGALGARPLAWLFGSPLGWLDVLLAAGLIAAGTGWVRRIVARAERLE